MAILPTAGLSAGFTVPVVETDTTVTIVIEVSDGASTAVDNVDITIRGSPHHHPTWSRPSMQAPGSTDRLHRKEPALRRTDEHIIGQDGHLYSLVFLVAKLIIASSMTLAPIWDVIDAMYGS